MSTVNVQIFGMEFDVEAEEPVRHYPSGPRLRGKIGIETALKIIEKAACEIIKKDFCEREAEFEIIRILKGTKNSLCLKKWKSGEVIGGKKSVEIEYDIEADYAANVGKIIIYQSFCGSIIKKDRDNRAAEKTKTIKQE